MKFVILLLLYGAHVILAINETLSMSNVIPEDVDEDLDELERKQIARTKYLESKILNEFYENAVRAYLDEDWESCIEGFNTVIHGYKAYKRIKTNCREKCRINAAGATPLCPENIDDLQFYEKKVRETLCLLRCNKEYQEIAGFNMLKKLPSATEQKLLEHRPYEYLHICYYKKERHQEAANTLYTFLLLHPEHDASLETLRSYLRLPDVKEENLVNLEAPAYVSIYFEGVSAYENEDYKNAVGLFETSLKSYLNAEKECRFYCEGSFDQGWHPEFTSSVANHFAYCLKCKRTCSHALNRINNDYREDMFRSHYHYLQFSYYKLGNLKAACAAVESYLLFDPADKTMLQNKDYYKAQPKVEDEYFVPREEALAYLKRQEYEERLLSFISDEFSLIAQTFQKKEDHEKVAEDIGEKESDVKAILSSDPPPGYSSFLQTTSSYLAATQGKGQKIDDRKQSRVKRDVYLIAKEQDLGGKNRYVVDGFLNSTECRSLMQLASIAAVEGDGYSENKSPHSKHERFEGISVTQMADMIQFGQIKPEWLELLLEISEQVREHVERYFELNRQLYFFYTHLVCRTALPDRPVDCDDLSHQVHADNCELTDEDTCVREEPGYTSRNYSAILYLNDDFDGGQFFFAKDRRVRTLDNLVSPRCGRMVAFSAGRENLHGVRGVLRGKRCALAIWFTKEEKYSESDRDAAWRILERVRRN